MSEQEAAGRPRTVSVGNDTSEAPNASEIAPRAPFRLTDEQVNRVATLLLAGRRSRHAQ